MEILKFKGSRYSERKGCDVLPQGEFKMLQLVRDTKTGDVGLFLGFDGEDLDSRAMFVKGEPIRRVYSNQLEPVIGEKRSRKQGKPCPRCGEVRVFEKHHCESCIKSVKQEAEYNEGVCLIKGKNAIGKTIYSRFDTGGMVKLTLLGWNPGTGESVATTFPRDSVLFKTSRGTIHKTSKYKWSEKNVKLNKRSEV
jgi:hypothetical protein